MATVELRDYVESLDRNEVYKLRLVLEIAKADKMSISALASLLSDIESNVGWRLDATKWESYHGNK